MAVDKIEKDVVPFGDLWKHNDYIKILQFKIEVSSLSTIKAIRRL